MQVIVHTMSDDEAGLARSLMQATTTTDSFVVGTTDQAGLDQMRTKGLTVQPADAGGPAAALPETPGLGAATFHGMRRASLFASRNFTIPELDTVDLTKPNVYLVQIPGPLLEDYRGRLKAAGAELMETFGGSYYSAFLTYAQKAAVERLPFVTQVLLYDARQTAPGAVTDLPALGGMAASPDAGRRMFTYDVRLHRGEDLGTVRAWLEQRGVAVAGAEDRKIRLYCLEDSPVLAEIAARPEVQSFEEFVPPRLWNDRSRVILGIDRSPGPTLAYDGSGEIIGIADTGLDDTHADFSGRIVAQIPRGRPARSDDPNGHGTHVAGSAAGDGSASNGVFRGAAPGAKLVFQSLLDSGGGLGGLPLNLGTLFDEAYQHGARIHSNSWGAATASTYTASSSEVDEYVAAHRDMLVVIAAGNEGQAAVRVQTSIGVVDWLSIGAPATAKNALTVGASRSDRVAGGLSGMQWGQAWPTDFPDPPIAHESVSGDPDSLAAFSSRGPSDDRRIKPDLVAPGTDILSCRSRNAPATHFWGPYAPNSAYGYMGGTSMATPLVAGSAALVRQYYRQVRGHKPSAALLRATLINGTRWLGGSSSNASNPPAGMPAGNFDQGFGRLDMLTTLPGGGAGSLDLEFSDDWQGMSMKLSSTGSRRRFVLDLAAGTPLRICLAYTDAPGRGLQNNLNLFVQPPAGPKLVGNERLRLGLGIPDVDNNVEVVRVADPVPGLWVIQISATNLLQPDQDFALVVTGHINQPLSTL